MDATGFAPPQATMQRATNGDIALLNWRGSRNRSWNRFWQMPDRDGLVEHLIEQEHVALQFLSETAALDRLEIIAAHLAEIDPGSPRSWIVQAQVAATTHRFPDARRFLDQARLCSASPESVDRLSLTIDQACGLRLDAVLETRRAAAERSSALEDLVPLGAILADMQRYGEADQVYRRALDYYNDVSPFALAWVCFQLGMLWGEVVPDGDKACAAACYEQAIAYLPSYVRARIHLAEVYAGAGRVVEAANVLAPALASEDPEAFWRMADIVRSTGSSAEADRYLTAARVGFDTLLAKYPLAYADHGAEFFLGSGDDRPRSLALAKVNLQNRPTHQAFRQAYSIAVETDGAIEDAAEMLDEAERRFGSQLAGMIRDKSGITL
jgi:tetratricopeptide (TPR) repeat protein